MSLLNTLTSITSRSSKRVGRGIGSGKGGHTAGRGNKGQGARTGGGVALWFEGGQLPLIKRLPMMKGKSRFKSLNKTAQVSLSQLNSMQAENISLETLKLEKVVSASHRAAKIIKSGRLKRKVKITGLMVTAAAQTEIERLGGQVESLPTSSAS